jgi:hypothetical protein
MEEKGHFSASLTELLHQIGLCSSNATSRWTTLIALDHNVTNQFAFQLERVFLFKDLSEDARNIF